MENTGYVALSRQMVLRRQLESIANNMANMSTTAYRAERMLFTEYLSDTGDSRRPLSFVQDLAQVRNLAEGPLQTTGAALDVAVKGKGYFVIQTARGERYTRDGHFRLSPDGEIVTALGDKVLSDGGVLEIPDDSKTIEIAGDGTVSADEDELGRLRVVTFGDEQRLKRVQGNYYDADGQLPRELEESEVIQGALETSNVRGIVEMTEMIKTLRAYQAAKRMNDQEHERQRRAIRTLVVNG